MSTNPITGRVEIQTGDGGIGLVRLLRMQATETLGRCFELEIVGTVAEGDHADGLPLDDVCGARCKVILERVEDDGKTYVLRTIHGLIASIQDSLELRGGRFLYEMVVAPRLWELSNLITQEIFVGMTVPEILRAKLGAAGMVEDTDFVLRLADESAYRVDAALLGDRHADGAKAPTPAEPRLIVQYRESDLAFLSRLCEHEGISFFFEHDDERDVVVFTDAPSGFTDREDAVPFSDEGQHGSIRRVARRLRSVPSSVYLLDYNYRAPDLTMNDASGAVLFESLGAKAELDAQSPGTVVEYAPNVKTQIEADRLAAVRADEQESLRERFVGSSDLPYLAAGMRFRIANHPRMAEPANDVVLVSVRHDLATPDGHAHGHGERAELSNSFEAVFAQKVHSSGRVATYRPARTTPKPRIHGLLTGVVRAVDQVDHIPGSLAARHHIDVEGRYLIRLHFDQGDSVMPRVRMAQPHAGASYGMHFPLRPGVEVIVAFLDGDPDRPIIVGAVPNPLHKAPVRQETSNVVEALLHMNEMNRIETRSGCIIQIGDGDPPVTS